MQLGDTSRVTRQRRPGRRDHAASTCVSSSLQRSREEMLRYSSRTRC